MSRLPRLGCRKCGKEAKVKRLTSATCEVKCCGITEKWGTPKARRNVHYVGENRDTHGRLHGAQPVFNDGAIVYRHGVLVYMDDGKGNEYYEGSEDYDEDYA